MKTIMFVSILISMFGCNLTNITNSRHRKCLNELKSFVSANWVYNKNNSCYLPTDKFSELFSQKCINVEGADSPQVYRECLEQLNMGQAEYIFGKPSEKNTNSMKYYLDIPAYDENFKVLKHYRHYMNLTFDTPNQTLRCIFMW